MLRFHLGLLAALAATLATSSCTTCDHGAAQGTGAAGAMDLGDGRTGLTVSGGATFTYGATPIPLTMADIVLDSTGENFEINSVAVHVTSSSSVPGSPPGLPIESATSLSTDYYVISASALNSPALTHPPTSKYFTIWVVVQGTDTSTGGSVTYDAKRPLHPLSWDPKPFDVAQRP